ncbi:MAG: hypothetical protein BWZ06_01778 [Bacteroidetes bacterium ADurb.BinA261]|nr:MAG: hypothetical protein BWZ06_01778 [Bacteroidetes bacterium ADurb.BinA261]
MVASNHHVTYFSVSNHFVEFQCYFQTAWPVLIKNARLSTHNKPVFFGIANPNPVILILTASVGIDAVHSCTISFDQIFMFPAQTNPSKRSVTIIEELRTHDVFHIRRKDESILVVDSVFRNFFHPTIVNRFHERITVIEKICATRNKFFYDFVMTTQRSIYQFAEMLSVFFQQTRAFFVSDACRTITTGIHFVARRLIAKQLDMDMVAFGIFQQIDNVAVIGNRKRFFAHHGRLCEPKSFFFAFGYPVYPPLRIARLNAR